MSPAAYALAYAILVAMECGGNITRYLTAYQDGGGVWTIGVGSTFMPSGRRVARGDRITEAEAIVLCHKQMDAWFAVIKRAIAVDLTDNWTAVLVSFVHQEGVGALPGSVLADMLNAKLWQRAARQLNGWVVATANGIRGPQLGIMRRQETQARVALGAPLEPTHTQVWALPAATLLPLYEAACSDAKNYRNGVVTWEVHPSFAAPVPVHQIPPATATIHALPPQSEADALMAAEQAGTFDVEAQG